MDEVSTKSTKGRARTFAVDILLGAAAVLISAASVAVAISANKTQERLLAASTWPNLEFGTSNLNAALEPEISLEVSNSGVGPARIRWSQLRYKGQDVAGLEGLLEACCKRPENVPADSPLRRIRSINSTLGPVLKAGDGLKILRLRQSDNPEWLWLKASEERANVSIKICYCSVLDTCWMFDSASDKLDQPVVKQCPAP
jgi:hypothetical protein